MQTVRDWLKRFPGLVRADTPDECLRMAWGAYGGAGSVAEFEAALRAEGFQPEPIGALWQIRLPTRAVNDSSRR